MTTLATIYAADFNLPRQREDESDEQFTSRISGSLRDAGHLIEAHEVRRNKRYDEDGAINEPRSVLSGVAGALAQALQGIDYGGKGDRQVGDDVATGVVVINSPPRMSADEALLLVHMLGSRR